jgi:catechol 2,3-dioxygenase-like lactoylglutathione lyase family enzyme
MVVAMAARLNLVTLGVTDLPRARRFYCDGLGFVASSTSNEHVVFLNAGGVVLALWGRKELAEDARLPSHVGSGFSGFSLAHNLAGKAEVNAFMAQAERAGAKILKEPSETFWGGYSGYFTDPDGFVWEVAHNPFWPLTDDGLVELPE